MEIQFKEKVTVTFKDKNYEIGLGTKIRDLRDIEIETKRLAPQLLQFGNTIEGNWLFRLYRGCVFFTVLMKNYKQQEFEKIYWNDRNEMVAWLEDGNFDIIDPIAGEIVEQFDQFWVERAKIVDTDGLYFFRTAPEKGEREKKEENENTNNQEGEEENKENTETKAPY